jgi:arylsulfatase A-like enzyme
MSHQGSVQWRRGLLESGVAMAVGVLFLLVGAWQQMNVMSELTADWQDLVRRLSLKLSGTPLGDEVLAFVAAQMLLHSAFGLACWLLALCTAVAFPQLAGRRWTLLFAWLGVGILWVLVGNATEYPFSNTGVPSTIIGGEIFERLRLFDLLSLLTLAAVMTVLLRAALAVPQVRAHLPRLALFSVLMLVVAGAWQVWQITRFHDEAPRSAKPNLIVIGIDSLRRDAVGGNVEIGLTPNIDVFLRDGGHLFTDAITPLARTFPSWTSILSGRYPRSTGARENLLPLSTLQKFDTIAALARAGGYHTVYATDEVRFSNIDQNYGFDQIITPTIGAADFLLGKANDLPLPNLISNTWLARKLFPATYGNRAVSWTYRPQTFVDWLDSELEPREQTLFAVHLTLPHNPYNWAEPLDRVFGRTDERAYQYANAVIAADDQFGDIMAMLERKGMLRNAIVVLLSDHGEALGLPASDTLIRGDIARQVLEGERINVWGHGTSVLSPHQFGTLLAVRGYGAAEMGHNLKVHDEPVSLVDIAPTLADMAGLGVDPSRFDGWSLAPIVRSQPEAERFRTRPRFTETGLRTRLIMLGDFDESRVMGEAASFFVMNPQTARFELRAEVMDHLIRDKERAVLSANYLLASFPADGDLQKYVLVGRQGQPPQRLETAPDERADPELRSLWKALHDHYGSELRQPAPRGEPPPMGLAAN